MYNQKSKDNLNKNKTPAQRREQAKKAGQASAAARKFKADFRKGGQEFWDDDKITKVWYEAYQRALRGNTDMLKFCITFMSNPLIETNNEKTVNRIILAQRLIENESEDEE